MDYMGMEMGLPIQHHGPIECDHNKKFFTFEGGGILRGFSGHVHKQEMRSHIKGINVMLAGFYDNRGLLFSNSRLCIPEKEPTVPVIMYEIQDRQVPSSNGEFELLIPFLVDHLKKGGQVNVSCMGGHGRTGLVMAVLYGLMTASTKPVEIIRSEYCGNAVESWEQKKFIHSYLKLAEPIMDIKMCYKCKKSPALSNDTWCFDCDKEWREAKAAKNASYIPSIQQGSLPVIVSGTGSYYCVRCHTRKCEVNSYICTMCRVMNTTNDINASSKPSTQQGIILNEADFKKKEYKKTYPKKLRHKLGLKSNKEVEMLMDKLDEMQIHKMNEEEFRQFRTIIQWEGDSE